jgi:alpha-glucosidase
MNEPAIFNTRTKTMPLDVQHRIDGDDFVSRIANHAEIHNVYGMQNSRATYEGLARLAPGKRPFVMTRASYAGGQRYAVTWTGDNSATWDHLKLSIHQILNLGLSGFAYSAADVSGFAGGPSPDLLTRWFEIGAFYPIFRDHSAKGTPRVEPWVDGPQHLAIRRRFVEERYRLLPIFTPWPIRMRALAIRSCDRFSMITLMWSPCLAINRWLLQWGARCSWRRLPIRIATIL